MLIGICSIINCGSVTSDQLKDQAEKQKTLNISCLLVFCTTTLKIVPACAPLLNQLYNILNSQDRHFLQANNLYLLVFIL